MIALFFLFKPYTVLKIMHIHVKNLKSFIYIFNSDGEKSLFLIDKYHFSPKIFQKIKNI